MPTITMSVSTVKAATAAASLLQVPHHGAQNHKRTSSPASDVGSNIAPLRVGRSSTANSTGAVLLAGWSEAESLSRITSGCFSTDTFSPLRPSDPRSLEQLPNTMIDRHSAVPRKSALTQQRLCVKSCQTARFSRCEYQSFDYRIPNHGPHHPPRVRDAGPDLGVSRYKAQLTNQDKPTVACGYDWTQNEFKPIRPSRCGRRTCRICGGISRVIVGPECWPS